MKNLLLAAIPFIIIVGGIIVIATIAHHGRNASRYNLALNRVQLCILSVTADERTKSDIEHCYSSIEDKMGVQLIRDIENGQHDVVPN